MIIKSFDDKPFSQLDNDTYNLYKLIYLPTYVKIYIIFYMLPTLPIINKIKHRHMIIRRYNKLLVET